MIDLSDRVRQVVERENRQHLYHHEIIIMEVDDRIDAIRTWCKDQFGDDHTRWDMIDGWYRVNASRALKVRFRDIEDQTLFQLTWS